MTNQPTDTTPPTPAPGAAMAADGTPLAPPDLGRITFRAFLLGLVFAGLFAVMSVRSEPDWKLYTTTQIPILPYVLLLIGVMAVNPFLRLIRLVRPFSPAELLIVFVMGMVSSGIATIGLASRLVPTVGGLFNKTWNTDQARWDYYIEPYVNESFFIAEPGTRQAALRLRDAEREYKLLLDVHGTATRLKISREKLEQIKAQMAETPASNPAHRAARRRELADQRSTEESALSAATKLWAEYAGKYDLQKVLDEFPARKRMLEAQRDARKGELSRIEGRTDEKLDVGEQKFNTPEARREMRAFQKVHEFRRGLPPGMRAIPGFLYVPGEGLESYHSRIRRLTKGTAALAELGRAQQVLDPSAKPSAAVNARAAAAVRAAMKAMEPILNDEALTARKRDLDVQLDAARKEKSDREKQLELLHNARYTAKADRADQLAEEIKDRRADIAEADKRIVELEGELGGVVKPQLEIISRAKLTQGGLGLTEEQRARAGEIFAAAATKAAAAAQDARRAVRRTAWEDIRKKGMTEEQNRKLDAMPWMRDANEPMPPVQGRAGVLAVLGLREEQKIEANEILTAAEPKAAAAGQEARRVIYLAAWDDVRKKVLTDPQGKKFDAMPWIRDGMDPMARLEGLAGLVAALEKAPPESYKDIRKDLDSHVREFRSFDASWERFWIGDIDWSVWGRPLLHWGALILVLYLVFMSFNILIFKQWAHNENIIYPLAELPTALAGADDEPKTSAWLPGVFRSGLFWVGLLISLGILAWNKYAPGYLPGVGTIPLRIWWGEYIRNSFLEPLSEWGRFDIYFTLIGLTFLIPARISSSLFGFQLGYLVLVLFIIGLGYGAKEGSFESDWAYLMNFRTAMGGGALVVFAGVILYRVRRFLFCAVTPSTVSGLDAPERRELRIASWLFLGGSVAFVLLLHLVLGANFFYSVVFYLFLLVITIGMIRAVAEAGFLSFKCSFGMFHVVRSVFGMDKTWTAPALMAPLFLFNSVLFLSYRAFIAPTMATALKIRDKLRMRRLAFHGCIAAGILVACALGVLTHLTMSYDRGGDKMALAIYDYWGGQPFGILKTMSQTNPVDTAGGRWWLLTGAIGMTGLLYMRRRVFRLPHPIGMIMLVNPTMTYYWFSIFLGWICKSLVSKYGNKDVYQKFRNLFIGLIVGELLLKGLSGQPLDSEWLWETP